MSKQAVETLMDRWMNDPAFRTELRNDAEGAVQRSGVELSEDELTALRSTDCWSHSDEELQTRISKGPGG